MHFQAPFADEQRSIAATSASAWCFAFGVLVALLFGGRAAHAQMPTQPLGDQIVVRPANPTILDKIEIDVPASACFWSQQTPNVATSSATVADFKILILLNQPGWSCFSAGDGLVDKPARLTLDPLPPGAYCIEYVRTMGGSLTLHRWLSFAVGQPHTARNDCPVPLPLLDTAVEYFHPVFAHYFVTNNADEIAKLDAGGFNGWQRTGQSFRVFTTRLPGTRAVCRYFTNKFDPKSSHYYGLRQWSCEGLFGNTDWLLEGDSFFMVMPDADGNCPDGMVLVYRLFNRGQGGAPNHRFTTDPNARAAMIAAGWIGEGSGIGVGMCGPT